MIERLVIMQGLPGAGKSSFVKRMYAVDQVVCLDDVRLALGHEFNPQTEAMVLAIADGMARSHLLGGRDFEGVFAQTANVSFECAAAPAAERRMTPAWRDSHPCRSARNGLYHPGEHRP